MSASDPKIDLMELADLAQPRKIALEIHRQLRLQYGAVPHRVPLEEIARAVGIKEIAEHETNAFEGLLVVVGDVGAVGLRKGMPFGRRNFTLGHELGHFLNPWHRRGTSRFECNKVALDASREKGVAFDARTPLERMEVEANEFAASLLVPAPEFREQRKQLGRDVDIQQIFDLARTFGVSKEFMARIFVDTATDKLCVLTSHEGRVGRIIAQRSFPYLGLRAGADLPRGSRTTVVRRSKTSGFTSGLDEIGTSVWVAGHGAVSALYEQVAILKNGWAMTLLLAEMEDADDDVDDNRWNRRSNR